MNIKQTTNTNNTNFKGAFRVAKLTPQINQEFQKYAKDGCKVFYDFSKQGDVLLVAHDRMNQEIETFLKKVCDKFTFWGNFTPNNFRSLDWIKTVIRHSSLPGAVNKTFSMWDSVKYKLKDLNDIGIKVNTDEAKLSMYKGVALIDDVANKRKIFVTPHVENNVYIKIYPYSTLKSAEYLRCESTNLSNSPAKIVKKYETPAEIIEFNTLFKSAKRNYDPDFMEHCPEARTKFELLTESNYLEEEKLFDLVVEKYQEIAQMLCYEDTFVPTSAARGCLVGRGSTRDKFASFKRFLKRD